MAKKPRQKISYVLPLANAQSGGHRLGVNGLAVDSDNAILYSGGRDGVVCAWDLNLDLKRESSVVDIAAKTAPKPTTKFREQTLAHLQWINDICLAQNNTALVSASSDLTVKVWRPHAADKADPVTVGEHSDYVKCVATPSWASGSGGAADWVASGGLDRKINLWDLNGGGKRQEFDVSGDEVQEKGSVYALAASHNVVAGGGPESIVRLWDARSGKKVTNFVGHTDTVRAILVNAAGDAVLTGSSDQTVKLWSVTAGRCMYTFTMHADSVWSLFSADPALGVFYSADRSGLVVKTDARGAAPEDVDDDGLSLAVARETDGVGKLVAAGAHIWTATATSSINRWADVDTGAGAVLPEEHRRLRAASSATLGRARESSASSAAPATNGAPARAEIPAASILRISNTAPFPAPDPERDAPGGGGGGHGRQSSVTDADVGGGGVEPIHNLPEETIEGQFGLVKHKLLNDRRRVLTLDTAGDVLLWDLIKCVPIQKFGKRHLEDVEPEVNTREAVAPWCQIDTSSGSLAVVLDAFNCFDAEMYADELTLGEPVEFREDQRINLGKWILRYLFAGVIDEEIKRDEAYRQKLNEPVEKRIAAARTNAPSSIVLPPPGIPGLDGLDSLITPRANGPPYAPVTPGLAIGLATPGLAHLPGTVESASPVSSPADKRLSQASRPSVDREDYFSSAINPVEGAKPATTPVPLAEPAAAAAEAKSPTGENGKEKEKEKDKDKDKENGKTPGTPFGKKFRMSFGSKKLGRSASTNTEKPAVVDEKAEESESSSNHDKEVDDSFLGVVQRIRNEYDRQLAEQPDKPVETRITPTLPNETPVLRLPPATKVILQEETQGGLSNVYMGAVSAVGRDADLIEQRSPPWLGDVLLQGTVPAKEPVKVSFVLHPWHDELPPVSAATDGNNRLNANRMLRVRKILAYVAERIDPAPEEPEPDALRPEEYLELYCNEQLLPNTMTLATLRTHVWKGGSDIVLYYKANGRKEIPIPPPQPAAAEAEGAAPTTAAPAATPQAQAA